MTVRNVAGFYEANATFQNQTLFSNLTIRDSVLSTLKPKTEQEVCSDEHSAASIEAERQNEISKPKLTSKIISVAHSNENLS